MKYQNSVFNKPQENVYFYRDTMHNFHTISVEMKMLIQGFH